MFDRKKVTMWSSMWSLSTQYKECHKQLPNRHNFFHPGRWGQGEEAPGIYLLGLSCTIQMLSVEAHRLLLWWSTGSRAHWRSNLWPVGLFALPHVRAQFLNQESNLGALHYKVDSQPPDYPGSPNIQNSDYLIPSCLQSINACHVKRNMKYVLAATVLLPLCRYSNNVTAITKNDVFSTNV